MPPSASVPGGLRDHAAPPPARETTRTRASVARSRRVGGNGLLPLRILLAEQLWEALQAAVWSCAESGPVTASFTYLAPSLSLPQRELGEGTNPISQPRPDRNQRLGDCKQVPSPNSRWGRDREGFGHGRLAVGLGLRRSPCTPSISARAEVERRGRLGPSPRSRRRCAEASPNSARP